MNININDLKNKIIYRSSYRGSKEMDNLLSAFVKEIIDDLTFNDLIDLSELLKIDDENLYKWITNNKPTCLIKKNKVSVLLKKFDFNKS